MGRDCYGSGKGQQHRGFCCKAKLGLEIRVRDYPAAGNLLEGSTAARTVLSVAAAVFVINASMTLVGTISQVRSGDSSVLGLITAGLLIVASIIAATATAQSYRGERNQKFFVTT